MKNDPIDIVIPWVDGNDPDWIEEKNKYLTEDSMHSANSAARYESWDNLQYIFRGIERFMPWIRKVFLVTFGHVPDFLNIHYDKIRVVKHSEYIPEDYLPTFNSNVIELNFHRISDLSENFILFNDDCFPLLPVSEEYYFINNLPCDEAVESPIMPVDIGQLSEYASYVKANDVLIINQHFNKREVQKKNWEKWYFDGYGELLDRNRGLAYWNNFCGFHDYHLPVPLKKSTMKHIWDVEQDRLDQACHNRFRSPSDLSQYLVRYWQLCTGEFYPKKSLGRPFTVTIDNYKEAVRYIYDQKGQTICLSENFSEDEFEIIKSSVNEALNSILPDKSKFEL